MRQRRLVACRLGLIVLLIGLVLSVAVKFSVCLVESVLAMLRTSRVLRGLRSRYGGAGFELRVELCIAPVLSVASTLSLQSGLPVEVVALAAATAMDIAIIE